MKLMIDICSGLEGASAAMKDAGWKVITVDIEPKFNPTIVADVCTWSWYGETPDLVWCSPPCDEFAREFMPWCKTGVEPDMSIYHACRRIISEIQPRYWIIENVRGAVRYFGRPREIHGPFFLWGNFPDLGKVRLNMRKKESFGSNHAAERGKIPYTLSCAVLRR